MKRKLAKKLQKEILHCLRVKDFSTAQVLYEDYLHPLEIPLRAQFLAEPDREVHVKAKNGLNKNKRPSSQREF